MSSDAYAVWFAQTCGACSPYAGKILARKGSFEAIYEQRESIAAEFRQDRVFRNFATRFSLDAAEEIVRTCENKGITLFHSQKSGWPESLRGIPCEPVVMYALGNTGIIEELDSAVTVTVVGTRSMSEYGAKAAYEFAFGLGLTGMIVISGMADGVDTRAHRAALDAGGRTIAVLGCGVDVIYPAKNKYIYDEILQNNLILSEYPPQTPPSKGSFPQRNRIMSALGMGTLIVEAKNRSGSLITANWAAEQGRSVFALMTDYDRRGASAIRGLIADGALAVSDITDIWNDYNSQYGVVPDPELVEKAKKKITSYKFGAAPPAGPTSKKSGDGQKPVRGKAAPAGAEYRLPEYIDGDELMIYNALEADSAKHVDDLAAATGLPASKISAGLTMLELEGAVKSLPGRHYIKMGK